MKQLYRSTQQEGIKVNPPKGPLALIKCFNNWPQYLIHDKLHC